MATSCNLAKTGNLAEKFANCLPHFKKLGDRREGFGNFLKFGQNGKLFSLFFPLFAKFQEIGWEWKRGVGNFLKSRN